MKRMHQPPPHDEPELLLVDDDPNLLAGLARSLRSQGFRVRTAGSGQAALAALHEQPADAIVSDQFMPGTKGVDLLAYVANLYPDTVRVLLTGEATLDVALQAINTGHVQRFLVKPCHPLELGIALRQQLEQRALVDGAARLLGEARRQRAVLSRLEHAHPGITRIARDEDGAIVLDSATDCTGLVEQIRSLLDEADTTPAALGARETKEGRHSR
jgi:two-component system probable response regulator PhcQ